MDFEDPPMCTMPTTVATTQEHHAANPGDPEHGGDTSEQESPVANGLSYLDYAHLGGEALVDGETSAKTMGGMFDAMGKDALEIWHGEGSAAGTAMKGLTAVAAPLSIFGGVMDITEGAKLNEHGATPEGRIKEAEGVSTTASGVLGLAGLASGAGATLAPVAGSLATGMKIGHYGDDETKELGWLHDAQGNAESASDWASDQAFAADRYVSEHSGSRGLGKAADLLTGVGTTIAGGAISAAGAVGGAAHKLWDWL